MDYYILLLVHLLHAVIDAVHDLFRHAIFVFDRDDMGNSLAAYRLGFIAEVIAGILSLIADGGFFIIMLFLHRVLLQVLRPTIETWKQLMALSARYMTWRRMVKFIETALPEATEDDLEKDDTCMVCRVTMQTGDARKLPCGHCLHSECLERWIGQQTKCPTCKADLKNCLEEAERNAAAVGDAQQPEGRMFKYKDLVAGVSD
jgi:hypothetical protein